MKQKITAAVKAEQLSLTTQNLVNVPKLFVRKARIGVNFSGVKLINILGKISALAI
jgi:hypothetical protein